MKGHWALLRRRASKLLVAAIAISSIGLITGGRSRGDEAEDDLMRRWYAVYDDIHESFKVRIEDSSVGAPLTSEMAMTIHNPKQRGVTHGRVYVWSKRGVPVAIVCLWSTNNRHDRSIREVCYEFHSVSERPVVIEQHDTTVWQCNRSGVDWLEHAPVGTPATSRTARLVQMRQIARSYSADHFRLQPQPIHRCPDGVEEIVDGAVFAYSAGNDPQVFLLVRATNDGWTVAFARSEILPVTVTRDDEVVWSVERGQPKQRSEPWFIGFRSERRRADNPEDLIARSP